MFGMILKLCYLHENNVKRSFCHFLAFCCVPKHVGMNEGLSFTPCQILIAIHQALIEICNGNHDWHVLVCINRILSKAQILWVLSSHELLSTLHVTHQSTYFIYSFHQVEFKFERILTIHQLKLSTIQDSISG